MYEVVNLATGEIQGDFKSKEDAEEWAGRWVAGRSNGGNARIVGWSTGTTGSAFLCVEDDE